MKKEVFNKYAVATSAAKKAGFKDFKEGSAGSKKREHIALKIAAQRRLKKK